MPNKPAHDWPPYLTAFLTGVRTVESGGNYHEPNGQGAYQILQSNWPSWATEAGYGQYAGDQNASDAPPAVQDYVAAYKVTQYFYGAGEKNYRLVARIWNGGSPNPVPNPALCPGCTTDDYADRVLAIAKDAAGNADPGGPLWANPPSQNDPRSGITAGSGGLVHGPGDPLNPSKTVGCQHKLDLKVGSLCMDKPIAALAIAGGGVLLLAGVAVILVATVERTPAGRAATAAIAVPIAAGRIPKRQAQQRRTRKQAAATTAEQAAARAAREQRAQAGEARREQAQAMKRTEARRRARITNAAEKRRQEAHTVRMATRTRKAAEKRGRTFEANPRSTDAQTAALRRAARAKASRERRMSEAPF